jgi:uncharacterized membrane protein required for colicin V production
MVNQLDYLLIMLILVGVAVGLRRGLIRTLISIVGIYFAVLVAGYAYAPIGEIVSNGLGRLGIALGIIPAHNLMYAVFVIAMLVLAEVLSLYTFEETRISSLRGLDNLLGGLVGVVYGALLVSLFLAPIQYGVAHGAGAWTSALLGSQLVPRLNRLFRDAVLDVVSILFVNGIPEIYANSVTRTLSNLPYHLLLRLYPAL